MLWWLSGKSVQTSATPTPHMFLNQLFSHFEFPVAADLGPAASFLKGLMNKYKRNRMGFLWGGFFRKTTIPSVK
jgi:hypothetical protein